MPNGGFCAVKLVRFSLLLLIAVVGIAAYLLLAPYGPTRETFVEIPAGTGTAGIAQRLSAAGVLHTPYGFELYRRIHGGRLKAGEYRFDHPATVAEVYNRIARGDVYTVALTIPEGYNIYDIAAAVERAGLGKADNFLAAEQNDTALIRAWNPHASSLEGYLFPDTYRFSRHATPNAMLAAMVKRFQAEAARLSLLDAATVNRTVTLASLIEKEVRFDDERPLVAGVFQNRLARNMPLQTDPAVIYAALVDGRWRGTIFRSDLQADSPYNTYLHTGLPPGPIANPGVAALRAAMHPAATEYLYFEADPSGHTAFSKNMAGHLTQVDQYRRAQAP